MNSVGRAAVVAWIVCLVTGAAGAGSVRVSLSDAPKAWEKTAGAELTSYLAKRLGTNELTVGGEKDVVFHVGDTALAAEKGLSSAKLADEEWVVRSFGRDVVVNGGGTRGCLYAAYHFLEDVCGVRWWSETEEDVPGPSALALDKLDLRGKPTFIYRDIFRTTDAERSKSTVAIRRRLNRNGDVPVPMDLGGSFDYGSPRHCHTFDKYIPWKELGKTHPELFSLVDGKRCGGQDYTTGGQLCLTNPEVKDRVIAEVRKAMSKSAEKAAQENRAAPRLFEVSMNDNRRYCQCTNCLAAYARSGVTDVYLEFYNAVADAVAAERPDAFVTTLAYYYTEDLPKTAVRARDNLLVKLCNTRQNMASSLLDDDNRLFRDLIGGWKDRCRNLFVWDYAITYTKDSTGYPFPSEFYIGEKYAYYATNGVHGIFLEHESPDVQDIFDIKYYLETKLMEDPFQDGRRLFETACREFFGPEAGAHVIAARLRLEEARKRRNSFLTWFPQLNQFNFVRGEDIAFMRREYDAAEKAVAGNEKLLRRVRRARESVDRLAARREGMVFRRERKGNPFWDFPAGKFGLYGALKEAVTKDPESDLGEAVCIGVDGPKGEYPLACGFYDAMLKKTIFSTSISAPEKPSGYGWVDVGMVTAPENGYLYLTKKWLLQMHLPNPDFEGNAYRIRAHMKFTGPRFDPSSSETNSCIWIDRIVMIDQPKAAAVPTPDASLPSRGLCGHQGDLAAEPSNTPRGLLAAVAKGAVMVEFDVQRCATGEFICRHDGDLATTTTVTGNTWQSSFAHIRSAKIRRGKKVYDDLTVPTFDEMIDCLPRTGVWANVHCYGSPHIARDIALKLKEKGRLGQAFVSASLAQLKEAKAAVPELMTCNMTRPGKSRVPWTDAQNEEYLKTTVENGCQFLQLRRPWPKSFSDKAHAAGVRVNFCPCDEWGNDPAKLKEVFDGMGIDFLLTENVEEQVRAFNALYSPWTRGADVRYVAHQGEEHLARNHTMAAYRFAVEHACDFIKLDVRETKDGEVVIQHDANLRAIYGTNLVIATSTLAELRAVCPEDPSDRIVTLQEALVEARKLPGVWIDFKHFKPAFAEKVFRILSEAGVTDDRIVVGTWSKAALRYVRTARPRVKRVAHTYIRRKDDGYHTNAADEKTAFATLEDVYAAIVRHRDELDLFGFNMPCGYTEYTTPDWMVKRMKDAGMWVAIWFVNEPLSGAYYRKAGADAFVTACKAETDCPVPGMMPVRGICARSIDAKGVAMIALKVAEAQKGGQVRLADGLTLDEAFERVPSDRMTWLYLDVGGDRKLAAAVARRIVAKGREANTIVAGDVGCMRAAKKVSKAVKVANAGRTDPAKSFTEKEDYAFVTQTALARGRFDWVPNPKAFRQYGYAHASGHKVIVPLDDPADARVLLQMGADFLLTDNPAAVDPAVFNEGAE